MAYQRASHSHKQDGKWDFISNQHSLHKSKAQKTIDRKDITKSGWVILNVNLPIDMNSTSKVG